MPWDVFVSHASEDKDAIARPLAHELRRRGLRVWYDEFELRIGDSLRASIDHGLAHSHHGIVVLSPDFFAKDWPPEELNGLVAREIAGRRRMILPVWHGLAHRDVAAWSPILADRVAANTNQDVHDLVDELLAAMDEAVSVRAGGHRRGLALSPPPTTVDLELVASATRLLELLASGHERVFDVDDIADKRQRQLAGRTLKELGELSDLFAESPAEQRQQARNRAQALLADLLEAQLLTLVGQYERRLTATGDSTQWNGIVVRVAPAAVVTAGEDHERARPARPTTGDQHRLDGLLGLLTRPSMRLIAGQDFLTPWPERIATPLSYLVHEYDEVEHRFTDQVLEQHRQRLLQAAHHFLHQEALNGFSSRVPGRRDGGWTPSDAEGDDLREAVLESRGKVLLCAAHDLLDAYDSLISLAADLGYSLETMSPARHPNV
jgi:hypothetical protein